MSKRALKVYEGFTWVNEALLAESEAYRPRKHRIWVKWAALAAALALAVGSGAALALPRLGIGRRGGLSEAGRDDVPRTNEVGAPTRFEGPVLPLTALGDLTDITAERRVELDPSDLGAGNIPYSERYDVAVRDTVTLTNSSGRDKTLTLLYPVTGSFLDFPEIALTVDGAAVEAELLSGPYSGTFLGETDDFPFLGFHSLKDYNAYAAALSDGRYLDQVLGETPELSEKVTVYEITDPRSEDRGEAPSIAMTFELDYDAVSVLTYGINGGEYLWDEGRMRLGFFVPEPWRPDYGAPRYIIVRGGEIGPMTVQGYENLGWRRGEEIEASADIRSYETTLGEILDDIAALSSAAWEEDERYDGVLSHMDLYLQELKRSFKAYGGGAFETAERYKNGENRLTDILNDILTADRIFALRREITVPAGGSVTVTAELQKPATLYNRGGEAVEYVSWSVAGSLGSTLTFTANTAEVTNRDGMNPVTPLPPGPAEIGEVFTVTMRT